MTDLTEVISGNKREEEDTQTQLGGLEDVATAFQIEPEQVVITEVETFSKTLDYTGNDTLRYGDTNDWGKWGNPRKWGATASALVTTFGQVKVRDVAYTHLFSTDFETFPPTLTDAHGVAMTDTGTDSGVVGLGVWLLCNATTTLTKITKDSGCTATQCLIYRFPGVNLGTWAFVGDDATGSIALTAGSQYVIYANSGGPNYTWMGKTSGLSYPYNGANVSFTKNSSGSTTSIYNIVSVTTESFPALAGYSQVAQSSTQKRSGSYSAGGSMNTQVSMHDYGALKNGIVRGYFYDTTSETSGMAGMCVDEKVVDSADKVWLGVYNPTSTTYYCYADGSSYIATTVKRSTGWHRFEFDYSSGTNVVLRIDNNIVYTGSALTTQFHAVKIGNWTGTAMTAYFDDIMMVSL